MKHARPGRHGRWWLTLALAAITACAEPLPTELAVQEGPPLTDEVSVLDVRPDVTLVYVLVRPPVPPRASVVLFTGGVGTIPLTATGIRAGTGNFLVRNRARFAAEGLLVAVPDAPSDRAGGLGSFRVSAEHAQDVAQLVAELRRLADVPVWLVGTSRGTVSAANAAARLGPAAADGLVLTASLLAPPGESLADVDLAAVRVPTLVVHHRHDDCPVTLFRDVASMMARLEHVPELELLTFDGGAAPRGDPCQPWGAHGFPGLDGDVVHAIARWITAPR